MRSSLLSIIIHWIVWKIQVMRSFVMKVSKYPKFPRNSQEHLLLLGGSTEPSWNLFSGSSVLQGADVFLWVHIKVQSLWQPGSCKKLLKSFPRKYQERTKTQQEVQGVSFWLFYPFNCFYKINSDPNNWTFLILEKPKKKIKSYIHPFSYTIVPSGIGRFVMYIFLFFK